MTQVSASPVVLVPPQLPPSVVAPRPYLAYADVMRVFAAILVILAHAAAAYLYRPQPPAVTTDVWRAANWMMALSRPCVPFFVMLSGLLLLNPDAPVMSAKTFVRKRVMRVLGPLLIWTGLFMAWRLLFNQETLSVGQLWMGFVNATISPHLWFMYMILATYLLIPVMQVYVRAATLRDYRYFAVLWLVVCVLLPTFKFLAQRDIFFFSFLGMSGFAGYFLLGYFLNQVKVPTHWRPWLLAICAIGTGLTAWLTTHFSLGAGKMSDHFYSYLAPNVVATSIAAFLLLKDLPYDRLQHWQPWFYPAIKTMSQLSLGVYLVHPMVMGVFDSHRLGPPVTQWPISPMILIPIYTVIVFGVSMAVSAVLRKVPLIGRYLC